MYFTSKHLLLYPLWLFNFMMLNPFMNPELKVTCGNVFHGCTQSN